MSAHSGNPKYVKRLAWLPSPVNSCCWHLCILKNYSVAHWVWSLCFTASSSWGGCIFPLWGNSLIWSGCRWRRRGLKLMLPLAFSWIFSLPAWHTWLPLSFEQLLIPVIPRQCCHLLCSPCCQLLYSRRNSIIEWWFVEVDSWFLSLLEFVWEFLTLRWGCGFCQRVTEEHIITQACSKMWVKD